MFVFLLKQHQLPRHLEQLGRALSDAASHIQNNRKVLGGITGRTIHFSTRPACGQLRASRVG